MTLIFYILIINALIMMIFHTPLVLMLSVISQTITTCIFMKMSTNYSWFAMVLFLIFLGGLLILFSYVTSLVHNEMIINQNLYYKYTFNNFINMMKMFIMFMLSSMMIISLFMPNIQNMLLPIFLNANYIVPYEMMIYKIYSPLNPIIITTLVIYLLLVLLVSVFIIKNKSSPLRSTLLKSK